MIIRALPEELLEIYVTLKRTCTKHEETVYKSLLQ